MKKYSIFCYLLIAIFYIVQVSVLGFTVYFLNENGYTALEVGVLLAVFGIIAANVQPLLGYIADTNEKVDFKSILTWRGFVTAALFIPLYLFDKNKSVIGVLFGIIFVLTSSMSPFVNASCFYYTNKGINVDFGKARGFGSFSFAIASYILGAFTKTHGSRVVSFNGIIFAIVFLAIVMALPRVDGPSVENKEESKKVANNKIDIIGFIKKYPSFFLMFLATVFAMCFQNADCGYLIQIIEDLGGDSSQLGTANAIAAMVEIPIMFTISRIIKKIKVKKLIAIACFMYVLRGFVFHIPTLKAIYFAQFLQMFSYAILIPVTVYLSNEEMQEEDKNRGQTFIGMAVTIGLILGSFVGGELISRGGTNLLETGCIVIALISFLFALLGNIVK